MQYKLPAKEFTRAVKVMGNFYQFGPPAGTGICWLMQGLEHAVSMEMTSRTGVQISVALPQSSISNPEERPLGLYIPHLKRLLRGAGGVVTLTRADDPDIVHFSCRTGPHSRELSMSMRASNECWYTKQIPYPSEREAPVQASMLAKALARVVDCAHENSTMDILHCVRIKRGAAGIDFSALDGHQFQNFRLPDCALGDILPPQGILINREMVRSLLYLLAAPLMRDAASHIALVAGADSKARRLFLRGELGTVSVPLSGYDAEAWPKTEEFLEKATDASATLTFTGPELRAALGHLGRLETIFEREVFFTPDEGGVLLSVKNAYFTGRIVLPAHVDGTLRRTAFPARSLYRLVRACGERDVTLSINTANNGPAAVHLQNIPELTSIIMPMRIEEVQP